MAILKVANVHHDASGFTRTQISTPNTILFVTNNQIRVTFSSSGNVGIGTTTPKYLLDINGTINSSSMLVNGTSVTEIANSYAATVGISANDYTRVFANSTADSSNAYSRIYANSTADSANAYARVFANSVGTSANAYARVFANSVGTSTNTYLNAVFSDSKESSNAYARVFANSVGTSANAYADTKLANSSVTLSGTLTTTSNMIVNGNIGVGTSSPSQKLHVVGTGFASSDFRSPVFYNSVDTNTRLEQSKLALRGSSPAVYLRDTDGLSTVLYTNGSLFYILEAPIDSETWSASPYPALWDLNNNDCTMGGNLSVASNITAYASDKRLKENITEIPNALGKIKQIRGVTFDWSSKVDDLKFTPQNKTNDIGCIAQEVQEVLPHVVTLAPFDKWQPNPSNKYTEEELKENSNTSKSGENYLTIQYERMVPLLIQAIKEQQEQIELLQKQINRLKGE